MLMKVKKRRLVIGPGLAGTRMTPEEFDAHKDWNENYRYELIEGVLVVSPPTARTERGPNDLLGEMVLSYRRRIKGKLFVYTASEETLPTFRGRRRADRAIWVRTDRHPLPDTDLPSVAVEFVGPRRRDRVRDFEEKRDEYGIAGISEYWIFDRYGRELTVFRVNPRSTIGFDEITLGEKEIYTTPLMPGFQLPLAEIFEYADLSK